MPERVHRSVLKNAPYNPRVISDENKERLRRKLKKRGLLNALVWNRTTGNLLGGHQRLACLDALEGHGNYLLDVDVVELSAKEEVEENLALNNPNLQGEYDSDLLADVLKMPDLELDATGFALEDVQVMFEDDTLAELFAPNESTKRVLSEVEKQQQQAKTKERIQKERKDDSAKWDAKEDTETIRVLVFKSREEAEACSAHLGQDPELKYLDGSAVMSRLEAALAKPAKGKPGRASPAPAASPQPTAAASPGAVADAPAKPGRSRKAPDGSAAPASKP